MAVNDVCYLMIDLKVHLVGVEKKTHTLRQGMIKDIDSYTYMFRDKNELFEKLKNGILLDIKHKYMREVGLIPVDIELGEDGVYVIHNGKVLPALFQNLIVRDQVVSLENMVLNRMFKGSFKVFFECDKTRAIIDPSYQSFFEYVNPSMIDRLELGCIVPEDVCKFYQSITGKNRFFPTVRFLLTKIADEVDMDKMYGRFVNEIPKTERIQSTQQTNVREKEYKYPYNND